MEMTLGKRIAALRKEKHFKQDDLAQLLNVSAQAISKWENDQSCPDISVLPELAKALGVSVDVLLCGEQEPTVKVLPPAERKDIEDMMLRVMVESYRGDLVRVNLPLALAQVALDMGMELSQLSGNDTLKNIDLGQIMNLVHNGAVGNLVEIESAHGDTIRIFVE